jgi:hypothetical protein
MRPAMKLGLQPFVVPPEDVTVESLALARWYDAKPTVRRLWAIRHEQYMRIIVAIEPTLDNDDIYPVWLVNTGSWARELHASVGMPVRLELLLSSPWDDIDIDAGGIVIAHLCWRDATT